MKLLTVGICFLISVSAGFASTNSPFLFDEFREEIKDMALDNHSPGHSYKSARRMIMQKIHLEQDNDGYYVSEVYCNIKFRRNVGPNSMPNHNFINVEHTWPRSRFGQRKGRGKFRTMEADLHHLFPSDSVTNSTRGNFIFSQFKSADRSLTSCPTSKLGYNASAGTDAFEPPEKHKGNVARALFYFAIRYDLRISEYEEFFLRQWNIIDPVDQAEINRNDKVEQIQGNRNPFIDDPELADLVRNF